MFEFERKGREFRSSGITRNWLNNTEPSIRKVVCSVNGALLEYPGEKAMHADLGRIELLRKGAQLYGHVETLGNGPVKECSDTGEIDDLWVHCRDSNMQLIKNLRNGRWEHESHTVAPEDARDGRTTMPKPVSEEQLGSVKLNQRFRGEHGLKTQWRHEDQGRGQHVLGVQ